jgi:hypothetical protein
MPFQRVEATVDEKGYLMSGSIKSRAWRVKVLESRIPAVRIMEYLKQFRDAVGRTQGDHIDSLLHSRRYAAIAAQQSVY